MVYHLKNWRMDWRLLFWRLSILKFFKIMVRIRPVGVNGCRALPAFSCEFLIILLRNSLPFLSAISLEIVSPFSLKMPPESCFKVHLAVLLGISPSISYGNSFRVFSPIALWIPPTICLKALWGISPKSFWKKNLGDFFKIFFGNLLGVSFSNSHKNSSDSFFRYFSDNFFKNSFRSLFIFFVKDCLRCFLLFPPAMPLVTLLRISFKKSFSGSARAI